MSLCQTLTVLIAALFHLANLCYAAKPCTTNACLSIVVSNSEHSKFPGCTAFFRKTVTPATVFVTTTLTSTKTTKTTSTTTEATVTEDVTTATETIYTTQSYTVTNTSTRFVISSSTSSDSGGLFKRKTTNGPVTNSQTVVPSYAASVCSNTKQYSSACSCISAAHRTTTVATPTNTETTKTARMTAFVTKTIVRKATETDYSSTVTETSTSTLYGFTYITDTTTKTVQPAPTVALSSPTPIALSNNDDVDDTHYALQLPFNISFYGQSNDNIFVSSNGPNTSFANEPLPDFKRTGSLFLPDTSLVIFWDGLYGELIQLSKLILTMFRFYCPGTNQGIHYQIDGMQPLRTLQVEWISSHCQLQHQYNHFIMSVPESLLEQVQYKYLDVADSGASATVGAQSKTANETTQYSYNEADSILPGLTLTYNTTTNTFEEQDGPMPS